MSAKLAAGTYRTIDCDELDIKTVEGAIVLSVRAPVEHIVLFKEEAMKLAMLIFAAADRLPDS